MTMKQQVHAAPLPLYFAKKSLEEEKEKKEHVYLYGFAIISITPFPSNKALSPQQSRTIKLRSNTLCIHAHLPFKQTPDSCTSNKNIPNNNNKHAFCSP